MTDIIIEHLNIQKWNKKHIYENEIVTEDFDKM